MTWTAEPVVYDDTWTVALFDGGRNRVAEITSEAALELADALLDAAQQPPTCDRPSCPGLAVEHGLCAEHYDGQRWPSW